MQVLINYYFSVFFNLADLSMTLWTKLSYHCCTCGEYNLENYGLFYLGYVLRMISKMSIYFRLYFFMP